MFDLAWTEIIVVAVIVLLVIGKWVGKARRLANDFQRQVNDMMDESGISEVADEVNKASRVRIDDEVRKSVDPDGSLKKGLEISENDDFFEPKDEPKPAAAKKTDGDKPASAGGTKKAEAPGPTRSVGAKKPAAKKS